ncbi:MAG: hypothetical protein ACJA07_002568 [Rhodococcus sp. (in: high G+C Gram-positive bacteria)]|jgi:hypothetical protein
MVVGEFGATAKSPISKIWSDGIFDSLRVDGADVHVFGIIPRNDEACEWT